MQFFNCKNLNMLNIVFQNTKLVWNQTTKQEIKRALSISQNRFSSYRSSEPVKEIEKYPEVEIIKDPKTWEYVKRLLPPEIIPKPNLTNANTLKLNQLNVKNNNKYFVQRTKNYMIPVYLQTKYRGLRKITVVRKILGDIWCLEKELRNIIENIHPNIICSTKVNELSCQIHIHGDYVNVVKEHLYKQGF